MQQRSTVLGERIVRDAAEIEGFSFPGGTNSRALFLQVLLFILLNSKKKSKRLWWLALLDPQDGVQVPAESLLHHLLLNRNDGVFFTISARDGRVSAAPVRGERACASSSFTSHRKSVGVGFVSVAVLL